MKKNIIVLALLVAGIFSTQAQVASKVKFHTFWVSLPDANRATNSFPVARDNLMAGLKLGGIFDSRGRENLASGLDFKSYFDAGDVATTTGAQTLWRFEFNPPAPFTNNFGNRGYCPVIVEGIGGQVSIDRLSWKVYGGILSGARDLASETYSPSTRIGVNKGPDGRLWTADDTFVVSGAGSLVDAIAYIGASLSSPNAENAGDQVTINTYLGDGLPVTVEYRFNGSSGPVFFSDTIKVYGMGQVPESEYGLRPIKTPYGLLWSLMAPRGSQWTIGKSSSVSGPYDPLENVNAGFSVPAFFEQESKQFYRVQRQQ